MADDDDEAKETPEEKGRKRFAGALNQELAEMGWTEGANHRPSGRVGASSTTRRELNASGLRGQAPFGV